MASFQAGPAPAEAAGHGDHSETLAGGQQEEEGEEVWRTMSSSRASRAP